MYDQIIVIDEYFDGKKRFAKGPYSVLISNQIIKEIIVGDVTKATHFQTLPDCKTERVKFLMPGLTEAHCHIFLYGEELDFQKRSDYLKTSKEEMLAVASSNLEQSRKQGITAINDAGDIYGVNLAVKKNVQNTPYPVHFLTAGTAIRKKKKYGSFMAIETETEQEIIDAVSTCCESGDFLKVLLTGIIDFENGVVKGPPQFNEVELTLIVAKAKSLGKRTAVHCSGTEGIAIACAAGVDSIEHGFFMTEDLLKIMAEKQIAWVPTFSPVEFQRERPEIAKWNEPTVAKLAAILDNHHVCLEKAYRLGVPVVAGADAGSFGVPHGLGLINDLVYMNRTVSNVTDLLVSATSLSRTRLGFRCNNIEKEAVLDAIGMAGSPFEDMKNLMGEKVIFG